MRNRAESGALASTERDQGWPRLRRRRVTRVVNVTLTVVFAVGFICSDYVFLGPAWCRGWITTAWDAVAHPTMVDEVSKHGRGRRVVFPDGSAAALAEMSWVRYPRVFGDTERVVQYQGEAADFVVRRGAHGFILRSESVTVETDTAQFSVQGNLFDRICAITVTGGLVRVTIPPGPSTIELTAPQSWRSGEHCPTLRMM